MDRAVNPRCGRRLGSSDGYGTRRLSQALYWGEPHTTVSFPHSPSSSQLSCPFAFELPLHLDPPRRLLLPPPRDVIPCSSPPLPDRGRVEHSAPPAWVECSGDRLG